MRGRQDREEEQKKKAADEKLTQQGLKALEARSGAIQKMGCISTSAGPSGITLSFGEARNFKREQQLDAFKVNIIKWCTRLRIPVITIWVEFPGEEREEF